MPRYQPLDRDLILAVYAETGSNRETARRLGIHENSVIKARRFADGTCKRCGGENDDPAFRNCSACRAWMAEHQRGRTGPRRQAGLCFSCNDPAVEGHRYCRRHLDQNTVKDRRRTQALRERLGDEAFLARGRSYNRKQLYGEAGVRVWERAGNRCEVCGAAYQKRRLHIHHIDEDKRNNAEENLIVLCNTCHLLVHHVLWHPNLPVALAWIKETYPGKLPD